MDNLQKEPETLKDLIPKQPQDDGDKQEIDPEKVTGGISPEAQEQMDSPDPIIKSSHDIFKIGNKMLRDRWTAKGVPLGKVDEYVVSSDVLPDILDLIGWPATSGHLFSVLARLDDRVKAFGGAAVVLGTFWWRDRRIMKKLDEAGLLDKKDKKQQSKKKNTRKRGKA